MTRDHDLLRPTFRVSNLSQPSLSYTRPLKASVLRLCYRLPSNLEFHERGSWFSSLLLFSIPPLCSVVHPEGNSPWSHSLWDKPGHSPPSQGVCLSVRTSVSRGDPPGISSHVRNTYRCGKWHTHNSLPNDYPPWTTLRSETGSKR